MPLPPTMRPFRIFLLLLLSACGSKKHRHVILHTGMGDIRVELSDSAPEHRDRFLQTFTRLPADTLIFYRVERDFALQFSEPAGNSGNLTPESASPLLGGSLAAAETDSAGHPARTDYFIVLGRPQTDATLDATEKKLDLHFSPEARRDYKKYGGLPRLHGRYSVLGQVITGIEVAQKIAALPRDAKGRPLQDVHIWVETEK